MKDLRPIDLWRRCFSGQVVLASLLLAVLASGCAHPRPVLYPNSTYERVGAARAERDVDECMARARAFLDHRPGGELVGGNEVAGSTVRGAAAGAAVGAVGSAVSGGDPGRGAKVGAATGATAGFLSGILHRPHRGRRVDSVFTHFVERCLRDKGYEPIGWR